jgi:uncharacterized protein (DUF433 family)
MAVAASVDIGTLITKSPEIWDGLPVITGTRVPVMIIAGLYKEGASPEEIARRKDLTLAQVYAALTHYHANQQQIEKDITEDQAAYDEAEKEWRQMRAERRA